jgi:hypothetical protein
VLTDNENAEPNRQSLEIYARFLGLRDDKNPREVVRDPWAYEHNKRGLPVQMSGKLRRRPVFPYSHRLGNPGFLRRDAAPVQIQCRISWRKTVRIEHTSDPVRRRTVLKI